MEIQTLYIVEGYKFNDFGNAYKFEIFIKDKNFTDYELRILAEAFKQNLTIKDEEKITKIAPDGSKMKLVLKGINEGLNVELYNNPELSLEQMALIYDALKQNLDVKTFNSPEFTFAQMKAIIYGLINKLDVTAYANPKYNFEQMKELIDGLEKGLNIHILQNEKLTANEMKQIKKRLILMKNRIKSNK